MNIEEVVKLGYDRPESSLCDKCKNAYFLGNGMVMIGSKMYAQRYCAALPIGISSDGRKECEKFQSIE